MPAAVNGIFDASTEQGLKELNQHLEPLAYMHGYLPSQEDAYVFSTIKLAPTSQYAHVARWYKHIKSFTEVERAAWPKRSAEGVIIPGAATSSAKKESPPKGAKDGDDDFDLFGSDEDQEDEEKKKLTEARLKAYAEKKSKKPGPIAKSNVIYDIKPWDDTIDIKEIESNVRSIASDGLVWGTSKVLPVAFGINKLQICCCVEDDKVSTDWLEEQITSFEDLVQSVDVVAFNKV